MLGAKWMVTSFAEKNLGILFDARLNMSQQRTLAAKKYKEGKQYPGMH